MLVQCILLICLILLKSNLLFTSSAFWYLNQNEGLA